MSENKRIPVVITTGHHRGIFFGYVDDMSIPENKTITAYQVRMCVYFPQETHGVVGLAAKGPGRGSKVTPAATEMTLTDVNAKMRVEASAVKMWEAELWS